MAMRYTTRVLGISVAAVLSACGGGDGTLSGPESVSRARTNGNGVQPSLTPGYESLSSAAVAIPGLGRRSVVQSSNRDRDGATTDQVTGVFDRGRLDLTVTRENGTDIVVSSREHATGRPVAVPVRAGQAAESWILESGSGGITATVRAFGERPADGLPLRAVHASGNWGTNGQVVEDWKARGRRGNLVPRDHIDYLRSLNVNWVGLSVALHYDDSADSAVRRVHSPAGDSVPTFEDDVLRQFIREFRAHGMDVYLTLAFESFDAERSERPVRRWQLGDPELPDAGISPANWPWSPDHPEHERFVAEFWETYADQAVHFARLAQEEGAGMFSLGTETDRLFRTRSGGRWSNHFRKELEDMVARVREVFSGQLTYDMHYSALTDDHFFGTGSNHLWEDLDLDVVGVSGWFPVADSEPDTVSGVSALQARYEEIFRERLVPLAQRNPDRPVVLLEYGAIDEVRSPANPGRAEITPFEFTDGNGNGLDDGRETQANMCEALLNTLAKHPGVVDGVFFWDNWISSDDTWAGFWAGQRFFPIRGKLSEDVVRQAYETWGNWLTGGHWMLVSDTMEVIEAGAFVDGPELSGTPRPPSGGTASYDRLARGGYAIV